MNKLFPQALQLLYEADDAVCLCKATGQVKAQTVVVVERTVAGKLPAALQLGPLLAGIQQFVGDAAAAVFWAMTPTRGWGA